MHITRERGRCLRVIFRLLVGAACLMFFHMPGIEAQEVKTPQRGYQIGGSYSLSEIESVNTTNGNVMLHIPMASLPQGRGGNSGFALNLNYNSKLWDTTSVGFVPPPGSSGDMNVLIASDEGGWRYGTGYELKLEVRENRGPQPCGSDNPNSHDLRFFAIFRLKMIFPDGNARVFHPVGMVDLDGYYDVDPNGKYSFPNINSGACFPVTGWRSTTGMTYYSADGSHLRLEIAHDSDDNWMNNPWTLYFPNGGRVTFHEAGNFVQRIYDRNNNYIEIQRVTLTNSNPATKIIDQLGRSIVIEHSSSPWEDYVRVEGANGEQLQWTVVWQNIGVWKTYNRGDGSVFGGQLLPMVERIILPPQAGSLSYSFGYNGDGTPGTGPISTGWGEVRSITLPSGAQADYQYKLDGQPPLPMWEDVLRNSPTRKDLAYQRQYDGSASPITETWNYTFADTSSEIIGPDGGTLKEHFEHRREERPYRSERADGAVIERIWQKNEHAAVFRAENHYVKTEFTSVRDSTGALVRTAIKDFNYDKNCNVTQVTEYDWIPYSSIPRDGSGKPTGIPASAATAVKRVTVNTYYNPTFDASDTTSDSPHLYFKTGSVAQKSLLKDSEVRADASPGSALTRVEYFYDNSSTTGNLTMERRWDSTMGGISRPLSAANSISVAHQYDPFGNRSLTTNANGFQTQFIYDPIDGHGNLYVTQTKVASGTAVQRLTTQFYDFHTGLVTQSTDVDNNVTTRMTYDAFGRPTLVEEADGIAGVEKQTATEYSDTERRVIVRSDLNTTGDGKLITVQHYDQLGRICLTRRLESGNPAEATDETKGVKIQTRYFAGDSNNSYVLVSAPYRAATSGAAGGEPGMAWKRTKFDKGGRGIEVETFAGAAPPAPWGSNSVSSGKVTTEYDAEFATGADQAGKKRRSKTDAIGRLVEVIEDPGGLSHVTSYLYDALNNLRKVTQGAQTRWFAYDSLSRLIRVKNPEQIANGALPPHTDLVTGGSGWAMAYSYDANGNLTSKTDARNITTTYGYDALNRNTTVNYSDSTPGITHTYDTATLGKGRLQKTETAGSAGSRVTINEYDAMGRPLSQSQQFFYLGAWGTPYTMRQTYDLADDVKTMTYPSGRTVNYSYDSAGRLSSFTGNLGGSPRTYADTIGYNAAGQMIKERFGANTSLYHNLHYNNRQQLVSIRVGDNATNTMDWSRGAIDFFYGATAVASGNPFANDKDNNGNLRRQITHVPLAGGGYVIPQLDDYAYDALNRISSFTEAQRDSGGQTTFNVASQNYSYDPYGNRRITSATGGVNNYNPTYDPGSNRIVGPGYDQAGNITSDVLTGGTMTYDAENRLLTASAGGGGTYTYDASGKRTRRTAGGQETWHIYGVGGELLAEYAANAAPSAPKKEYGYRGGQILIVAESGSGGGTSFVKPASQSRSDLIGKIGSGAGGAANRIFSADEPFINNGYGSITADSSDSDNTGTLVRGGPRTTAEEYGDAPSANSIGGELLVEHPAGDAPSAPQEEYRNRSGLAIVTAQSNGVVPVYPTAYQTPDSGQGGEGVNSQINTGHSSTSTVSSVFAPGQLGGISDSDARSAKWSAFQSVSGAIVSVRLKFSWSVNGGVNASASADGGSALSGWDFKIDYSLNGGSSWTNRVTRSLFVAGNDDQSLETSGSENILLSPGQNITQIQVRDYMHTSVEAQGGELNFSSAFANITTTIWDIRLEVEMDTTAPVISGVAAGGITTSGATITWTTNENSDSQVVYGTTTNYGQSTTLNPALVTAHSQGLSGLTPGMLYYYRVKSRDAAGNLATSDEFTFTTVSPDTTAPVISNVAAGGITTSGATITWTTNENADSQVEYGPTTAYEHSTTLNPALVTAHSQALSGLAANTLYHYRVKSRDAAGNLAISGDFTFTTAQNGSAGIKWLVTDHLGSTRMVIDETGSLAGIKRHDFCPFGEELSAGIGIRSASLGYGVDSTRQKFTGKERDDETGLDYFHARYYSNIQGRFTSVDPENAGAIEDDPQSWNGYAYARNAPSVYTDPDGRKYEICGVDGKDCYTHSDDDFNAARGVGKKDGYTFTGDGKYFEKGEIRDKDGNVIATYQQTSLDEPAHQLAFEMQRNFGSPDLYKRVAANLVSGAAFGAALGAPRLFRPKLSKVDAHSRAAAAADRGGYTKAGRSLTKHGAGARPGNSKFPSAKGSPQQINQMAQDMVNDILTNPGTTVTNSYRGRFGNTIEYTAPDGRGLVFKASGEFLFFKE